MKKINPSHLSILLIGLFFLPITFLNAQIDLELSLSQSTQNPSAWTPYSITATIVNKGPETAQGVELSVSKPDGTIYQGGNEYQATAGTFSPYNSSQVWTIPSLDPNEVAILTLNIFPLSNNISPVYAQVIAASPQDVDSTPNNGVAPIVAEDDEAYSSQNQIDRPDLLLADIQIPNSGKQGNIVSYTLDLVNAGTAIANGDYSINVYLSQFPGQISSGTSVGEINTGNTPTGTIDNVPGAINIPADFPKGNWFAVFYVDAGGDISEANENNNIVSIPFEVLKVGGPIGDFCGFEKEYFDMPEFLYNPRPVLSQTAQESNGNYAFKVRNGNSQVGYNYVDLLIDAQGNQLSIDEDADPFPNTDKQLSNGGSYVAETNGNNDLSILVRDVIGNIVFDKTYTDLTNTNRFSTENPKVIYKSDGYYVIGTWIEFNSPNTTYVYLAELDAAGNLLGFIEEPHVRPAETLDINPIAVHPSGELIISIKSITAQDIYLARISLQGLSWSELIVADLISNEVPSIQYDLSQNSVYLLLFYANEQYVRKVNAADGSTLWTKKLSEEFNPNSTSIRVYNLATSMVVTADGGVATAYVFRGPFDSEFQTEVGKLDSDGNAVWWRQFDWTEVNILEALFETSDGGIIYAGRTEDKYVIYKLNQNGQPTPLCNDDPGGEKIDLALTYSTDTPNPSIWSFFSVTLSISNTGAQTASDVVVNVPLPDGVVYRGDNEYTSSQGSLAIYGNGDWNVGSLTAGATAQIQINYFLRSTSQIDCYAQVTAANEEDVDSTPDNGIFGVVVEDDEAGLSINDQGSSQNKTIENAKEKALAFKVRKIFPNPAINGEVNVLLSSRESGNPTVQVYNSQGRLVQQEQVETTKGINQFRISIDQLSSGMYFLMIQDVRSKVAIAKFFVERE